MARIVGVDLPREKKVIIALGYIYGIGRSLAKKILEKDLEGKINPDKRVKELTEEEVGLLNAVISKNYKVEGELRREVQSNIKRYVEIGCYRGYRHRRSLPVRGQRTRTNGRTRRGRRKTVGAVTKSTVQAAPAKK
ncbi:MAG: 30S ribosomal protein S13 [Elusimicrobiales bacterium]|jgi:small subunit ribosomal protein S13|nr:30S ribosomal protein S13 [Elusimicrobiales bacterium]HOJ85719.1 30S ribosomal protein S13 [Elusimicrobiales bacterium]HOL61920.1 30S ribosomal protein S13 [Elusimicrobiales bacterium]HPO96058.1 30S ribosomal protein S13 [Elusimicrobiales bacterium]